jgi:16S rRNA (cytosine1402-N4)-methyltransferase
VVKAFLETRTRTAAPVSRYAPSQAIAVAPSFQRLSRKVKTPDDDETSANRRARSAKLRAALRTSAPAFTAQDWIDPAPLARQEWERLT